MQKSKRDYKSCETRLRDMLASENLDSRSSDELFELLDEYIGAATESEMDVELVSACFARLRELHPEKPKFDKEAGLVRLIDAVNLLREGQSRRANRSSRFVSILVALLVVAATAFGVNPFEYLYRFAETVSFQMTPSGEMDLPPNQGAEYCSLQEALGANNIAVKLPQWIPPGFSVDDVDVMISDEMTVYMAVFMAEGKTLQIHVITYTSEASVTYEKESGGYVYESGGSEYYIIPNTNNLSVVWTDGPCNVMIHGQITEAEAKRIIDSIN